jgi:predicted alpha/beta-hydrolase family hydrolase
MSEKRRHPGPIPAVALLGVAAVAVAFFFKPYPALEDKALLASDSKVRVASLSAGLLFAPAGDAKDAGLVVYCGARVPPEAYAYLARACAEAGYPSVLASMPLNFALLDPSKATAAAAACPSVARWVIAGHSLGGVAASSFAARSKGPIMIRGLLLLASYPDKRSDLSTKSLPVVTVTASRDALAPPAKVIAAMERLPADTRYVEIAGGNHAQFGEYGPQPGDGIAEITGPTQRKAVVEEALGLLGRVAAGSGR